MFRCLTMRMSSIRRPPVQRVSNRSSAEMTLVLVDGSANRPKPVRVRSSFASPASPAYAPFSLWPYTHLPMPGVPVPRSGTTTLSLIIFLLFFPCVMATSALTSSEAGPVLVWRSVKFFDTQTVKGQLQQLQLSSVCASPQYMFAGECEGRLTIFDAASRNGVFEPVLAFQAFTGPITHMKFVVARNVLVTLGDDDALNVAIIRLWDVAQTVALYEEQQRKAVNGASGPGASWRPPCVEHRLFSSKYPSPAETVVLPINYNADLLSVLQFNSRTTAAGTSADECIPVTSLRTVVVSVDVAEDLKTAAIALTNNDVVTLHGELDAQRSAPRVQRLRSGVAKGRVTFVGLPSTSHVRFRAADHKSGATAAASPASPRPKLDKITASNAAHRVLFTVHEDAVTVWRLAAPAKGGGALEAVEHPCPVRFGAAPRCACLDVRGRLMLAASTGTQVAILGGQPSTVDAASSARAGRDGGAAAYDPTDEKAVRLLDMDGTPKRQLVAHRDALVVLTQHATKSDHFALQCYNVDHQLRMLTRGQEQCVNCAFIVSDHATHLLVLAQEASAAAPTAAVPVRHAMVLHTEVSTQTKLDLLFHKECYGVAKDMAKRLEGIDPTLLQSIQQRYGDYLYSKGRFEEAVDQYKETIGTLEPSYVIRKYISAQHIAQLTCYLEELHHERHGHLANVSHTTLLLNCYIKQKALTKLVDFVHRDNIRFDPLVAIQVCREGGCYEAALYIADKYAKSYDYIRIQLHDLQKPREALDHLRTLGVDDAEEIVKRVGKELLSVEPVRTTQTLTELCVHWGGPARRLRAAEPAVRADGMALRPHRTHARDFLHIFVESPVCLLYFLRAVLGSGVLDEDIDADARDRNRVLFNTLLELYLMPDLPYRITFDAQDESSIRAEAAATTNSSVLATREVPRDDPISTATATGPSSAAALMEQFPVEPLARRQEQAMSLLEAYSGRYDDYVVLSLLYQYPFDDGKMFLLQKLQLSGEVLKHYGEQLETSTSAEVRREAKAKLFEVCLAQERASPTSSESKQIWMSLLAQLVRAPSTDWQDVVKVLDHIETHRLLSPITTIEILSGPQSRLQLRTVRAYCQRVLRAEMDKRTALQAQTERRLQELNKLQEGIRALQTTAVAFSSNVCAHCGQPLDLPVMHFLCRHSFHERCLSVSTECNLCAPQHQRVLDSVRERQQLARDPRFAQSDPSGATEFFDRLHTVAASSGDVGAEDGFTVITDYIARGALCADPHVSAQTAGLYAGAALAQQGAAQAAFADEAALYDDDGNVVDPAALEIW